MYCVSVYCAIVSVCRVPQISKRSKIVESVTQGMNTGIRGADQGCVMI